MSQLDAAVHQLKGDFPSNPEELTNEDNIKTLIKLFTLNYKAVPDVQQKLAQLQESMGLESSLPQLFLEQQKNYIRKENEPSWISTQ